MQHGQLPADVALVRTTDTFDADTVPAGLLRAHRVAEGVWGRLRVREGALRFVWEDERPDEEAALDLVAGDAVVIPPQTPHRVEPGDDARFEVEFHR